MDPTKKKDGVYGINPASFFLIQFHKSLIFNKKNLRLECVSRNQTEVCLS